MRRRINWLVFVLGLGGVTASPAIAQVKSVGLLAGVTFAKFGGSDAASGSGNESKVGFMGGGFVDIGVGGIVSIRPEVAYVQKGAKASSGGAEIKFKLDYIEVPVLLTVSVPTGGGIVRPELFAGPAVGFRARCREANASTSASCADLGVETKSTDFGLMFGAGVAIRSFMASVRYDLGLTKIDDSADPEDIKNRALLILVGWAFPLLHM